ncbi:MAG: type I pullulanase [Verrucomicrobiia bacterium]
MTYWRWSVWFVTFRLLILNPAFATPADSPEAGSSSYRYAGDDLGAVYSPQETAIKLWAPTAKAVRVLLFNDATNDAPQSVAMVRDGDGIWSAHLTGDLDGKYYLYEIIHQAAGSDPPVVYRVNDPYARGCSANTGRTLIYDPKKTNPEGWDGDRFVSLKHNVDAILYEVHIRDFSINRNSGISDDHRGKFPGMVQEHTRTPAGEASGIDHLKELGISHVHLLPAFDYAGGDETQKVDDYSWYNWGYDPFLYNTPEGSYATDPDGTTRQREFKQMVQAFHAHNIGVVMDVVYNHTAATGSSPASIFDKVFPRYYYRIDANGSYANGTGCGNEFASEKPMARKFIVDSIKYWMTEYHVDGFRFDLMGMEDRDTMAEVYREARKLNPNAIIYGEGWQMEHVLPPDRMMTQAHVAGTGMAAFNDGIRDNVKGDYADGKADGFIQGAAPQYGGMERFHLNIKGQSTGRDQESIAVFSPNETVNYASVHDDLCLWDKLLISAPEVPETLRINMDQLAAGILLTSQGIPFLHAGDEFLRSKHLNSNSYNSNDPLVNPIDWSLKTKHKDVFQFYQGLIALRRAHPAFRMTDKARVDEALKFAPVVPADVVEYVLKNHANGDSWKTILVIFNGTKESKDLTVAGDWAIVANDKAAGTRTSETAKNKIHVAPFSLVIAHTDGAYQLDANP